MIVQCTHSLWRCLILDQLLNPSYANEERDEISPVDTFLTSLIIKDIIIVLLVRDPKETIILITFKMVITIWGLSA